ERRKSVEKPEDEGHSEGTEHQKQKALVLEKGRVGERDRSYAEELQGHVQPEEEAGRGLVETAPDRERGERAEGRAHQERQHQHDQRDREIDEGDRGEDAQDAEDQRDDALDAGEDGTEPAYRIEGDEEERIGENDVDERQRPHAHARRA